MVSEENKHIEDGIQGVNEKRIFGVVFRGFMEDVYTYSGRLGHKQYKDLEIRAFKILIYEPAMCLCRKKANIILCCIRQSIVHSLRVDPSTLPQP